jgi:hypothetical protein
MPLNRLNNSLFWRIARSVVARVERSETRGRPINSHTRPGFAAFHPGYAISTRCLTLTA